MRGFRFIVVFSVLLLGATSAFAEWGTTQGDESHDGYVSTNVSAVAPQLLWSQPLPSDLSESGLAVGDGEVFIEAGNESSLYALNEGTGNIVWNLALGATNNGSPAYSNGVVYLQTQGGQPQQNLVRGWDALTQNQVFSATFANQGNVYGAPVVDNGSLYVGGGYYGGTYSYNVATSATNWMQGSGSYGGWSPAVDANYVYSNGGGGSNVEIYNKSTGALVSQVGPNQEEAGATTPLLTGNGGLFYSIAEISTGYFVNISQPTSPQVVWSVGDTSAAPAYNNGVLYLPVNGSSLEAINVANGQVLWSLNGFGAYNNLVVTDNVLFAEEGNDTVAIDLATHQVLWSVPVTGTLALSDNILFIVQNPTPIQQLEDPGTPGYVYAYSVPEPSAAMLMIVGIGRVLMWRCGRRA